MSPDQLTIEASALHIAWDAHETTLTSTMLRAACRCAQCAALARRGAPVEADADVTLLDAVPIGNYAVQLRFSDGHERGVFPWSYLRELSRENQGTV